MTEPNPAAANEAKTLSDNEIATGIVPAANQVTLTLSLTLLSQLKNMSHREGLSLNEMASELLCESLVKRVFEEKGQGTPSHLMTRNGYLAEPDGNTQPQMSHHAANGNSQNWNGNFQQRQQKFHQNGNQRNFNGNYNNNGKGSKFHQKSGNHKQHKNNFNNNKNNHFHHTAQQFLKDEEE